MSDTASARVVVERVLVTEDRSTITATVALARGGEQVVGSADGTTEPTERWRIVADAALLALRQLEPAAERVTIEVAGVQRIGDRDLAVVTLVLAHASRDELLAGVAPVRLGAEDAVVRAVLDATNRRLARLP